jgi:hypothetical protein
MGWGMNVKNVYLSRITQKDVEAKFYENERLITYLQLKLLQLATATPRDLRLPDEAPSYTWEDYVREEVEDAVTELVEAAGQNFVLGQVLDAQDMIEDDV